MEGGFEIWSGSLGICDMKKHGLPHHGLWQCEHERDIRTETKHVMHVGISSHFVTEIHLFCFFRLHVFSCQRAGLETGAELQRILRRFYPDLTDDDSVTVLHFHVLQLGCVKSIGSKCWWAEHCMAFHGIAGYARAEATFLSQLRKVIPTEGD